MIAETSVMDQFIAKMNKMGKERQPFLFLIDFEMNKPMIVPLEQAAKRGIYFDIGGIRNFSARLDSTQQLSFAKSPVSYQTYLKSYSLVGKHIRHGNTFLLNLTFPTEVKSNWDLTQIFYGSTAPYKLLFQQKFVLFSPESFVKISDGVISSFPMKGTIDAAIPCAREVLLADEKEKAEHATIVDLIRNDLSMVASDVSVRKFRYVDEVVAHDKRLLQTSSEIIGQLPNDYLENLGTIIVRLLPAGSICGAPKASTLKIIREAETYRRGYYTGVFGIFDGEKLDTAVMIRFIEQIGKRMFYKSGGGITIYSDPEKEYNELIDKVYVPVY